MLHSLHLKANDWRLFKKVSAPKKQKLSLPCGWYPSFSASLPLHFLEIWDLPLCPCCSTISVNVCLSETLVLAHASWRDQPMLLLQPEQQNYSFCARMNAHLFPDLLSFFHLFSFFFQHSLNTESHSKRSIWEHPLLSAKSVPALLALYAGIARQTKKRISVSTGSILLPKPSRLHYHCCFYIKDRFAPLYSHSISSAACCCVHKSLTFKLCFSPFTFYLRWLSQNKIKKTDLLRSFNPTSFFHHLWCNSFLLIMNCPEYVAFSFPHQELCSSLRVRFY